MKVRAIKMDDELWEAVGEEAEKKGLSRADYVRRVVQDDLANHRFDFKLKKVRRDIAALKKAVREHPFVPMTAKDLEDPDFPE